MLPLRLTPLLHPLLLPLMPDLLRISSLPCRRRFFFFFFLGGGGGLGPRTYVAFSLMNIYFLFHHFRLYLCTSHCSA